MTNNNTYLINQCITDVILVMICGKCIKLKQNNLIYINHNNYTAIGNNNTFL